MRRILVKLMVLFAILILLPSVSANCVSYGFFSDDTINHRSFLMTEGYHFGNELFVETNCETQIIINGEVQFRTNSTATLFIPNGIHNIELKSENSSRNYSSVLVQGGSFLDNAIQSNNSIYSEDKIQISVEDLDSSKVFVAIGNSLILFILITVIYWRVINIYTDRYYFEEVIS